MADHQQGLAGVNQIVFEPAGGLQVEVVGGFVQQQDVGVFQQQSGQQQAILLAAAQLRDVLLERAGTKTQPDQDSLDLVVEVVCVAPMQLVLQMVEPASQSRPLCVVLCFGQAVGELFRFLGKCHKFAEGLEGFLPHGPAVRELRLLFQVADTGRRVQLATAAVGLFTAGENLQQRGLPGPVRTHHGQAFPLAHVERDAIEHRFGTEVFGDVLDREKDHGTYCRRTCREAGTRPNGRPITGGHASLAEPSAAKAEIVGRG